MLDFEKLSQRYLDEITSASRDNHLTLFDTCMINGPEVGAKHPLFKAYSVRDLDLVDLESYQAYIGALELAVNSGKISTTSEVSDEIKRGVGFIVERGTRLISPNNFDIRNWQHQLRALSVREYVERYIALSNSIAQVAFQNISESYNLLKAFFEKIGTLSPNPQVSKMKRLEELGGDFSLCALSSHVSLFDSKDTGILTKDSDIPRMLNTFTRYAYDKREEYPEVYLRLDRHPIKVYGPIDGSVGLTNNTRSARYSKIGSAALKGLFEDHNFEKYIRQTFNRLNRAIQRMEQRKSENFRLTSPGETSSIRASPEL